MIGLIVGMIAIVAINYLCNIVFVGLLHFDYVLSVLIADFVVSFVLAFIFYRGSKKDAIKDPVFHKTVVFYFLFYATFSILGFLLLR